MTADEGIGVYRGPVPAANPCQSEQDAYDAAVAKQRETQRKLDDVNSREKEKKVKATKDKKQIAKWEADVKKATKENNDAVNKVNDTFRKLQDCQKKNPQPR